MIPHPTSTPFFSKKRLELAKWLVLAFIDIIGLALFKFKDDAERFKTLHYLAVFLAYTIHEEPGAALRALEYHESAFPELRETRRELEEIIKQVSL